MKIILFILGFTSSYFFIYSMYLSIKNEQLLDIIDNLSLEIVDLIQEENRYIIRIRKLKEKLRNKGE